MGEVTLTGLDGSNPLAFLAALGALRLLSHGEPMARLCWRQQEGAWRPVLSGMEDVDQQTLCNRLLQAPALPGDVLAKLGKNVTVPPEVFGQFVADACGAVRPHDRRAADFAAAIGSEVCIDSKKNRIEYTDFCFITGSGHQDFVDTARDLVEETKLEHLQEAVFGPWHYRDRRLSMRWDPGDAAEYALRWGEPGPAGARGVWGASRLAVEALPLFPVQPTERGLATTGFRENQRPRESEFTWPIWVSPVTSDTVRSLVALAELREESPDRSMLRAMGVAEVFRCRRVPIGQGANFKVSFRPARSV